MPEIGNSRVNSSTGNISFPVKVTNGSEGSAQVSKSEDSSELMKKIDALEGKIAPLSLALTMAQAEILALSNRISDLENK